jgi:hypothetical protein
VFLPGFSAVCPLFSAMRLTTPRRGVDLAKKDFPGTPTQLKED